MSKSEQVQLKGNKRIVVCDAHAKIKIFSMIKSFDSTMLCMCPFGGTVDSIYTQLY